MLPSRADWTARTHPTYLDRLPQQERLSAEGRQVTTDPQLPEASPAKPTIIGEIGDELCLLMAIAMADGQLHEQERIMLERFADARAKEVGVLPGALEAACAVRWAQSKVPNPIETESLIGRLRQGRRDALATVMEMAHTVTEADGMVTGVETVRLAKLKQLLDQAAKLEREE